MRYESRTVYFEHKYIIDNPYLSALNKLHLALMPHGVYGKTDACAYVHMPGLGKELDVERHSLHVPCRLRRIKPRDTLSRAWVMPLPFLHVSAKLGVGLDWSFHF